MDVINVVNSADWDESFTCQPKPELASSLSWPLVAGLMCVLLKEECIFHSVHFYFIMLN